MRLRSEAGLGIGSLVAIQLATSVVAIVLLLRMSPAIDEILADNVYSEEAVEEMLAVLAQPQLSPEFHEQFQRAFARAAGNVTEAGEPELLDTIEHIAPAALEGDVAARTALIATLQELGRVNRESMIVADNEAQRIGYSGAWAAAAAGTLGFWLGMIALRRMRVRIELPVREGMQVLQRASGDDTLVRWSVGAAPEEVRQIARAVNQLLEARLADRAAPARASFEPGGSGDALRRVLLWTIDQIPQELIILDPDDHIVAANQAAMEGNPGQLARHATAGNPEGDYACVSVAGSNFRVLIRRAADAPDAPSEPVG